MHTSKFILSKTLFKPVDAVNGQWFLRLFGLVIVLQVFSYLKVDFINSGLLPQKFLFPYDFFSFVKPVLPVGLKLMMLLIFLSGLLLLADRWVLPALITFILCFLYFFLLEKSYYNNHFYLMLLMALLCCFFKPVPAPDEKTFLVPYWIMLLFQFQIVIVYFYGGIAKLTYDWLYLQEPMHILLNQSAKKSLIPSVHTSTITLYLLNYGGLLFDLCIGFMLWIRKTRKLAIVLVIVFNVLNFFLFNFGSGGDIGIFPLFMISSLVLFASPEQIKKITAFFKPQTNEKPVKKGKQPIKIISFDKNKNLTLALLGLYVCLQLLLPLRHLLYAQQTGWTGKANKFSWRMKVNTKSAHISYYIKLNPADSLRELDNGAFINSQQELAMADDPVMIWQFAQFMGNEMKKKGLDQGEVYVSAKISLNGRPYYPIIDSTLNLLKAKHDTWKLDSWLLPFPENTSE